MSDLKLHIRSVPDFPRPGILFRDIAPLLRHRFDATIAAVSGLFNDEEWTAVDAVAGIESRGFIVAAALAERHRKGFVPVRKRGKLPPPVVTVDYELEYGKDVLEMAHGNGRLLLVDDVLATGGTLRAAANLCRLAGYDVAHLAVLIDLHLVPDFHWQKLRTRAVIEY